jgi:hypothetical protein
MGMCLGLCTLRDENIQKMLADPPLIWKVIAPDDPEAYEVARQGKPRGFLGKLFGARAPQSPLQFHEGEVAHSDLDKAWHGLHYMLTQSASDGMEPLCFLVTGGREVGGEELGYGPARVFSAEQVRRVHAALQAINHEVLRARYNPEEMTRLEIYPSIWDREGDEALAYCQGYFDTLKSFVGQAVERKLGLVIYLS